MYKINKIIKTLIISDIFLNAGWGLLAPVFAIFLLDDIAKGDARLAVQVAGMSALIFWVIKSFLQIPISRYLDEKSGEKDDFWFMFVGLFFCGLVPFGFLVSTSYWHIYAFQILHAASIAFFIPAWYAIFTRHIDKGCEAFEWGMDSTFLGMAVGISGGLGGIFASFFGFKIIFVVVGAFNIVSALILLFIYNEAFPRDEIFPKFFPPRKE
jgi:MFS family permease